MTEKLLLYKSGRTRRDPRDPTKNGVGLCEVTTSYDLSISRFCSSFLPPASSKEAQPPTHLPLRNRNSDLLCPVLFRRLLFIVLV
ncbi:hypothetical protein SLEP1_g10920 [Rubroshorea leprosula]|uniref:Uncharacterized protein n=1 Tax=Rubroshorea leprosula TaxID=152421 RepID=A0AAV5I9M0_9ROSI|nr:hypothetical protein SLEP1_g10920 [Rubroshorea leprosula]